MPAKSGQHLSDSPVNIVGFGGHHPSETSVTFRRNTHLFAFPARARAFSGGPRACRRRGGKNPPGRIKPAWPRRAAGTPPGGCFCFFEGRLASACAFGCEGT